VSSETKKLIDEMKALQDKKASIEMAIAADRDEEAKERLQAEKAAIADELGQRKHEALESMTPFVPLGTATPCRACGSIGTIPAFERSGAWVYCRDCDSVSAVTPSAVIDDRSGFDEAGCHLRLTTLSKHVARLESLGIYGDQAGKFGAYCDAESITVAGEDGGPFDVAYWIDGVAWSRQLSYNLATLANALNPSALLALETHTRAGRSLRQLMRAKDVRPESGHALIVSTAGLYAAMNAAGFQLVHTLSDTTTLWRKE
jgi:hypothetical protein